MKLLIFVLLICFAIMCELFCAFYCFTSVRQANDSEYVIICKFIMSLLVGWLITPIWFAYDLYKHL